MGTAASAAAALGRGEPAVSGGPEGVPVDKEAKGGKNKEDMERGDKGGKREAENRGDPTSNRRRAAGMAACSSNNSSSHLYYGIHKNNACISGSRLCSRSIHLALAWNRILSCFAVQFMYRHKRRNMALCRGHGSCCPVPLYSGLYRR